MFPFILVFTTCMAAQPTQCVQRELAMDSSHLIGCSIAGQQFISFWLSQHPKQFWKTSEGFKCRPVAKKQQSI